MITKYWVEINSFGHVATIARIDIVKETEQRVYFDKKSIKIILGHSYYVPSWQYKTGTRLFDTLKEAYENCVLTWMSTIFNHQAKIKNLESMIDDMRLRLKALGPLVPEPERDPEMGTEIDAAREDKQEEKG